MRLETNLITPDLAAMFLQKNHANRRLRENHVRNFMRELQQGTFRTTHQGIAISTAGHLLDGQHRLTAIVRSGIAASMVIAWDCEAQLAIDWPVDYGIGRTSADIMGFTKDVAATVDCTLKIYTGEMRRFSTHERQLAHDCVAELMAKLDSFCTTKKRLFSRTSIRVPAMLRLAHDETYPGAQYHALVHQDYDSMSTAIKAFTRKLSDPSLLKDKSDATLMARAWIAFDPLRSGNCKQQVAEPSEQIAEMRAVLHRSGFERLKGNSPVG